MKTGCGVGKKQGGAVAIMVGLLSFFMLIGMLGIAVDLSQLYSRKTELQNAADAAALSGAKDLNQTAAGVASAINDAIATFAQNSGSNLIGGIAITAANIRIGSCPNPSDRLPLRNPNCTFVAASSVTSDALAAGMTFIEVDTGNHSNATYFMPTHLLQGAANTGVGTYGYAVAGRFVHDVTPIGVCAITPNVRTSKYTYPDGSTELVELGFRRGVSYNIINLNPLGASGTPFLINPVDAPPGGCDPNHSSANFTAPFVCQGNSAVGTGIGTGVQVYVNTGFSTGPIEKALNSRFDQFPGGTPCIPATAPPDANIKPYPYTAAAGAGGPRDWSEPGGNTLPSQQTMSLTNHVPTYAQPNAQPGRPIAEYGALWSYTRAYQADGSTPPKAGNYFDATNANWQKLYNNGVAGSLLDTTATGYPGTTGSGFPSGTPPAPYNQRSAPYFQPPPVHPPGMAGRRVLNIVIVDCTSLGGGGLSCAPVTVKGIGKFFMQVPADLTGNPKKIEAEFAGLIEPVPLADIKLYR